VVHVAVLQHDSVVVIQHLEAGRRLSTIEMACPSREALVKASNQLGDIIAHAESQGEHPVLEGWWQWAVGLSC